jgi:hypothetical protein
MSQLVDRQVHEALLYSAISGRSVPPGWQVRGGAVSQVLYDLSVPLEEAAPEELQQLELFDSSVPLDVPAQLVPAYSPLSQSATSSPFRRVVEREQEALWFLSSRLVLRLLEERRLGAVRQALSHTRCPQAAGPVVEALHSWVISSPSAHLVEPVRAVLRYYRPK